MKNWRTFAASFLLALSLNGDLVGIPLRLQRAATFVSIVLFGYHAKDRQVTGGSVFQGDSPDVAVQKVVQDKEMQPLAEAVLKARVPIEPVDTEPENEA